MNRSCAVPLRHRRLLRDICGGRLTGITRTSGKGYKTRYYIGSRRHTGHKHECPKAYTVPVDLVEPHVLSLIRGELRRLAVDEAGHYASLAMPLNALLRQCKRLGSRVVQRCGSWLELARPVGGLGDANRRASAVPVRKPQEGWHALQALISAKKMFAKSRRSVLGITQHFRSCAIG